MPLPDPWQQHGPGCPHDLRWQHRPLRPACPPTVARLSAIHIDTWWQLRPGASALPLVVTQAIDINTDPSCKRTMNPDMVLGGSPAQDLTMATSYLVCPSPLWSLKFQLSLQSMNPSTCLFHLSTMYPTFSVFSITHFFYCSGTRRRCLRVFLPGAPPRALPGAWVSSLGPAQPAYISFT